MATKSLTRMVLESVGVGVLGGALAYAGLELFDAFYNPFDTLKAKCVLDSAANSCNYIPDALSAIRERGNQLMTVGIGTGTALGTLVTAYRRRS